MEAIAQKQHATQTINRLHNCLRNDRTSLPNPKLATTWRTTEIPQDVLHYLRLRNRLHFGQAAGTPLTLPPFSTQLDGAASTSTADLILEGDYTNDELTDIQELMINHCARQGPLDAIPAEITVKEFESRFRTWDECTSTSPSGIHLGHYKALIRPNDADSTTDEGRQILQARDAIIQARVNLINYSLKHGYSYQRWHNVVNVMIQKDPGNQKIHRLRVIHLYEADYNFLLGHKLPQLLHHGEKQNTIHQGQHGGRPGHEATTLVFMEELKNDISYATRKSLINFDNDAASCYDRIIPALASLLGRGL